MDAFVSKYVREQKRYTKNDLRTLFSFTEEEIQAFLRRLKAYGVMKAVKNTPLQMELSDLTDEDRLEPPIVAESYVVRRLFRPTVAADRAEVFVMGLDDVYPGDTTAVWTLGTKCNDIDHI